MKSSASILISPRAAADIQSHRRYIIQRFCDPVAADRIANAIFSAIEGLGTLPKFWESCQFGTSKIFVEIMVGLRMESNWDNGHLVRCRWSGHGHSSDSLVQQHCLHECRTGGNGRDVRCPSRSVHIIA